uniref:Uncharacterized protein n=1 Tax=Rhizophora mucronata TaxID=61149 RepID=A0A2P2MBH0_RHIMU
MNVDLMLSLPFPCVPVPYRKRKNPVFWPRAALDKCSGKVMKPFS